MGFGAGGGGGGHRGIESDGVLSGSAGVLYGSEQGDDDIGRCGKDTEEILG